MNIGNDHVPRSFAFNAITQGELINTFKILQDVGMEVLKVQKQGSIHAANNGMQQ